MIKMPFLMIDQVSGRNRCEIVSVHEARVLREAAKKRHEAASFMCPVCKQAASPHGGKVPLHGEHKLGSGECKPNNSVCKES